MNGATYYATPRLRETLDTQGRKATWLAEQVRWSKFQMSHVMAGRRPVPTDRGQAISTILGVPFGVLFEIATANDSVSLTERAA